MIIPRSRLLCSLAWGLALGLFGYSAESVNAQSVTPPIAGYQGRARSSFQLENGSLFPLTVVLEVRGFKVTEEGEVVDVPLDSSRIHVKLSEMSFRIPPRSSHRVFYEANSDSLPAWFNILSAMTGTRTESGLNVRLLLPHVVYLNQKQPLKREQVALKAFQLDPHVRKARVLLENRGPSLGRIQEINVSDGESSRQGGGFPLFPHSQRWAEVSWDGHATPTRLQLRFQRFTIDTSLTAAISSFGDTTEVVRHP